MEALGTRTQIMLHLFKDGQESISKVNTGKSHSTSRRKMPLLYACSKTQHTLGLICTRQSGALYTEHYCQTLNLGALQPKTCRLYFKEMFLKKLSEERAKDTGFYALTVSIEALERCSSGGGLEILSASPNKLFTVFIPTDDGLSTLNLEMEITLKVTR